MGDWIVEHDGKEWYCDSENDAHNTFAYFCGIADYVCLVHWEDDLRGYVTVDSYFREEVC